jgi:hypothetical protein
MVGPFGRCRAYPTPLARAFLLPVRPSTVLPSLAICAKHIVAAGLKRVVSIEPYPKSYAEELHSDSIDVDADGKSSRVNFERFLGISPFRYRELFEKGKRKYSTGEAQRWNRGVRKPMIDVIFPSYFQAETHMVSLLEPRLQALREKQPKRTF